MNQAYIIRMPCGRYLEGMSGHHHSIYRLTENKVAAKHYSSKVKAENIARSCKGQVVTVW